MKSSPQKDRPVDMGELARLLGVSKTTVHYALSRKGRVSQAVRRRVQQAADELGYRPNLLARSLRTKKTHTLGVILSSLTSSFHAHLLETIDRAAQENGYSILLACSYRDPIKEKELVEMLLLKGVDGMIVVPIGREQERRLYDQLLDEGVSVVFVDRDIPNTKIDSVAVDNFLGGRIAASHLIERGRKSLAFLTMVHQGIESPTLQDRLGGCNYALQCAGLPPATVLGLDTEDQPTGELFAYNAVSRAIRSGKFSFDGFFTANDNLAYGTLEALREAGLRVPKDISLVGFDDQDPSAFMHPPLTTVRQPIESVGACAVDMLLKRLTAKSMSTDKELQRLKIEPMLVVREST
jgi:LacI family transcriptional regulator, galactose operon repressor